MKSTNKFRARCSASNRRKAMIKKNHARVLSRRKNFIYDCSEHQEASYTG